MVLSNMWLNWHTVVGAYVAVSWAKGLRNTFVWIKYHGYHGYMFKVKNTKSIHGTKVKVFICSVDVVSACSSCDFLARWLTSARAYRIGGRKLCPSVCLYVKRYLLLQFCTDYNQTWINMIWAVAAKTLLSQIFHNWRRIEVNCVYISHCKWYRTSAGMPACIPNRRCCAGQCAGQ